MEQQIITLNEELKIACKKWLQAALNFLSSQPMPVTNEMHYTFHENGYQGQGGSIKIDYTSLFINYRHQLVSLPEYANAVQIVRSAPTLSSILFASFSGDVPQDPEQQNNAFEMRIITLLYEYLKANNNLTFLTDLYDRIYYQLEQYIYSTEPFRATWLVHIRNLALEPEKILLDRGLILRQTSHDEKEQYLNRQRYPNHFVPTTYLEIHHSIDRVSRPNQQEAAIIAQSVVLALRLIKANPIGIDSYLWDVPDQPFRDMRGMVMGGILPPFAYSGERYVLTEKDAQAFPKLLRRAKKAYTNSELSIVLTRLDDSYLRTKQDDKLIDYWVALEALFFALIPKEYVSSMGDTVAANIAYYIGNTESERRSIFASIIASHKVRGYLVHGQRGAAPQNIDIVVKKTEQYLRLALRKRIEEPE